MFKQLIKILIKVKAIWHRFSIKDNNTSCDSTSKIDSQKGEKPDVVTTDEETADKREDRTAKEHSTTSYESQSEENTGAGSDSQTDSKALGEDKSDNKAIETKSQADSQTDSAEQGEEKSDDQSDKSRSQKKMRGESDSVSNSKTTSVGTRTTGKKDKTGKAGKAKEPWNIGGRRGPGSNVPEGNIDHQTEYNPRPELVCRKNRRQWEILLVVPEERLPVAVQQNGVFLCGSNGEYSLNDFSEDLTVIYEDSEGKERVELYKDESPLIFKLRKRWRGDGRKIRGISRGYFIVFTPNEWARTGDRPVIEEACSDESFLAHYFYSDGGSVEGGFEGHELPSNREAFWLRGSSIYDDSEQGPLFIGKPPNLEIAESVSWVRIGEEGGGDWKGENFRSVEQYTVNNALNGRQGWFYVRIYDQDVNLIDGNDFRYSRTLKEIRVDDRVYSNEMLLVPSTGGYRGTVIQFIGTEGSNIFPTENGNNSHTSIRNDGAVIVEPHPDGDRTEWAVGGVDTAITLPRIWWRITETENFSDEWRATPIDLSREEFRENIDAVVHISLPSNIQTIQVGFDSDLDRLYSATFADENENRRICELPIRDFVDYGEINSRLLEDTYLQVQCSGEVIPIIRVPAEEPLLREIRVNGTMYSEEMLLVPSTNGYTETIIRFLDIEGNNIFPTENGNNSHTRIRNDGAVIVEPHPDGDLTKWTVDSVDIVIRLPRVWWRIMETDDFSDEWRDTPIVMPRERLRGNRNAVVHISLPPNIQTIQVGFDYSLRRSYSATFAGENRNRSVALRIRDLDHKEIERPSSKSTYLSIQCNGKKVSIIRVPGEGEICPRCDSDRLTKIYSPNDNLMWYWCQDCRWESPKYPQSAIQTIEEQK